MGISSTIKKMGLRGIVKSQYHSIRHTNKPSSLLFSSKVITEIDPESSFFINERLTVGLYNTGASHPRAGKSVFTTTPGSTVTHSGEESATIGPCSVVHVEGDLSMGDCRLNSNVRILCADEITIGDGVSIAWNVQLLHSNRHELWVNGEKRKRSSPIVVGDNVWIGHDTTITKGVEIGDGAIVASNSVVLNDVPENTIVGGCPAEILEGSGIAWSR